MKFDNYVNKPIPVGKKDGIYKIIKLGSRETGYYEMTLKEAVDQFNVGRGIDAGNGWCGWNDQDPDNPKKKCDCTTTLRTVEEIEFDETDTFGNRMTWTEKVVHVGETIPLSDPRSNYPNGYCWAPYGYGETTRHDIEFEIDYAAWEVNCASLD